MATTILAIVLVLACGCGCRRRVEPGEELLSTWEDAPLINVNALSVSAFGPEMAYGAAVEAQKAGLDLFAAYKERPDDRNVRLSIAYLLLLQESDPYLWYAAENAQELIEHDEFRVWTFLLWDHEGVLRPAYRKGLIEVLEDVSTPYARVTVAHERAMGGAQAEAVEMLLDVLVEGDPLIAKSLTWQFHMHDCFAAIPAERRAQLLLPLLDADSVRGAHAAYVLADGDLHRERALAYLESLRDRAVTPTADVATRLLERLASRLVVPADNQQ